MGYSIDYQPSGGGRRTSPRGGWRLWLLTLGWFFFFTLLVKAFWDKGDGILQSLLWREPQVLAEAVRYVFLRVRSGEALTAAVGSFCREVLWDAAFAG